MNPERVPGGAVDLTKRIVVAADGSPASRRGLEEAVRIAPRFEASVVVVFVRHIPLVTPMAIGFADESLGRTLDDLESEVRDAAREVLEGTGIEWDFVVRAGSPGQEIVNVGDEVGAELVIVGSNRHSSLHNLVIGSTTAYLATHSRVPVLVVRPRSSDSGGDAFASTAVVPPRRDAVQRWEMTESSPQGGARRRPEFLRVLPNGGKQR